MSDRLRRCLRPAFGVSLLLAASAAAQSSAVWPSGYAARAGDTAFSAPFTISGANLQDTSRSVTTCVAASLPFRAGSALTGIAFRRDMQNSQFYSASSGRLRVALGPIEDAAQPTASIHSVFSERPTVVFDGTISFPGAGRPISGPAAFQLVIPFDEPFDYSGGDLGIDLWFEGPIGVWRRDGISGDGQQNAQTRTIGPGCYGSNGFRPHAWVEVAQAVPGGELRLHLDGAPISRPNGIALNLLGFSDTHLFGRPLPLPLDTIGFPAGCTLWTDVAITSIHATADHSTQYGRAIESIGLPLGAGLAGTTLFNQWMVVDPLAGTHFPLTLSNALEIVIGHESSTPNLRLGRSIWLHGYPEGIFQGGELGPRNAVPIIRFDGTLVP